MTRNERDIRRVARTAAPAHKRIAGTGQVERRFARDFVPPIARGKPSPIRAWRADGDGNSAPEPGTRTPPKAATFRQPPTRDANGAARPGALERAVRMRAIEQAWKEELARQADLEV